METRTWIFHPSTRPRQGCASAPPSEVSRLLTSQPVLRATNGTLVRSPYKKLNFGHSPLFANVLTLRLTELIIFWNRIKARGCVGKGLHVPGDPKECREHAKCCLPMAAAASSPMVRDQFPQPCANVDSACTRARSQQEVFRGLGRGISDGEPFTASRTSCLGLYDAAGKICRRAKYFYRRSSSRRLIQIVKGSRSGQTST